MISPFAKKSVPAKVNIFFNENKMVFDYVAKKTMPDVIKNAIPDAIDAGVNVVSQGVEVVTNSIKSSTSSILKQSGMFNYSGSFVPKSSDDFNLDSLGKMDVHKTAIVGTAALAIGSIVVGAVGLGYLCYKSEYCYDTVKSLFVSNDMQEELSLVDGLDMDYAF